MKKEKVQFKCKPLYPIPEYTGFKKDEVLTLTFNGERWDGHQIGECVGLIYEDGRIESGFKVDNENNNTELFDRLRNDMNLIEKHRNIRGEDLKLVGATQYYIPFVTIDHCSLKPTIKDSYVNGCSNVRYHVTYEVLFVADDDLTRYLTIEYTTEGSCSSTFFDQVMMLEDTIMEMANDNENDFSIVDGLLHVAFYDSVGEKIFIDVNKYELLSMISSIRVIKMEHEILKNK